MSSSVLPRSVRGVVRIPGDKSISHRYAMLAAIAEGNSRFQNFSAGARLREHARLHEQTRLRVERLETERLKCVGVGLRLKAPAEIAGLRKLWLDHAHA